MADTSKAKRARPVESPATGQVEGEDVAKELRANDELQFKADLNEAAEKAEGLHDVLKALVDDGKNLPVLGHEDHERLRAAEDAMAAVGQVLSFVALRVRMEVSND